jgi:hypothetical protein
MPTPPLFKYYMKAVTGHYLYVDNATGQVMITLTKTALQESPEKWADIEITMRRVTENLGVLRTFSVPMSFVRTTAKIIRFACYNGGHEAIMKFVIEKRNETGDYNYTVYYEGDIDLSQFVDDDYKVTVNVMEAGLPALFKANENLPVELPLTGSNVLTVRHDGTKLQNTTVFTVQTPVDTGVSTVFSHVPSISDTYTESVTNVDIQSQEDGKNLSSTGAFASNAWFFKASANTTVTVDYDFSLLFTPFGGFTFTTSELRCFFVVRDSTGATVNTYLILNQTNSVAFLNVNFLLQGSLSIPMSYGDQLYLQTLLFNQPNNNPGDFTYSTHASAQGIFKLRYESKFPDTDIPAKRYFHFAEDLIKASLGTQYNLTSSFLSNVNTEVFNNKPWNTLVTGGSAIRQLKDANGQDVKVIKTTIGDMAKDVKRWGLGVGIAGDNVVIEKASYFFQNTNLILELGEVRKLQVKVAQDFLGNAINTGYQVETYDFINAIEDFHNKHSYKLDALRVVRLLDWSSPYVASIFAIEEARGSAFKSESTDSQHDDRVFLMEVNGSPLSGKYYLRRPPSSALPTGLSNPTNCYNIGLSPKRTILNNSQLIKSIAKGNVTFQSCDKNRLFATNFGGVSVDEDANETISSLTGGALFQPYIFEFEAIIPRDAYLVLYANPYGRIELIWEDVTYGGFLIDIAINDAKRNRYKVQLLAAPDVNMLTLVK